MKMLKFCYTEYRKYCKESRLLAAFFAFSMYRCRELSVLVRAAMELSLETFLGSWHHVLQYLSEDVPLPVTSYIPLTHFTVSLLYASTTIRSVAHTSLLRHSFISIAGTGISACFPSTTPFGLALGPDLPWADEPSPGILRFSAGRILTCLFAY